jgi:hypothetical protein
LSFTNIFFLQMKTRRIEYKPGLESPDGAWAGPVSSRLPYDAAGLAFQLLANEKYGYIQDQPVPSCTNQRGCKTFDFSLAIFFFLCFMEFSLDEMDIRFSLCVS